jgi:3-phenylpropionate/trans-cinnamate dioxygenase ferredoxin reductase subunit
MISSSRSIVVVGGSIAALTAAEALRVKGHSGPIIMLSEEAQQPYTRVPLSKSILGGEAPLERALLPAPGTDIDLRLNTRAVRLDIDRRRVHLADGDEVAYDGLVIATGARARRLSGSGESGPMVLRTFADAAALADRLVSARSVLVVGAGFLGMEIASTCRSLGKTVTVIDRDPPLARLLGGWLAGLLTSAAREQGIYIVHAPAGVTLNGAAEAVTHAGGTLAADVIVSAVGDLPNVEWLYGSGLELAGGVVVDENCRAATNIVAAGDVAVRRIGGALLPRSPHWTNATEQARAAANTLLDPRGAAGYQPDPYFWTEQFGLDVKISGELPLPGQPVLVQGSLSERSALLQWHDGVGPVAAAAVNHRMPIVALKKLGHRARQAAGAAAPAPA